MKEGLVHAFFPELGIQVEQKIHEIYSWDQNYIIFTKDQTFALDSRGVKTIPDKGRIYTQLILFWFEKTKEIIQNHLVFSPDPNVMVIKKYHPIPIEIVVYKYICGQLWKGYEKGKISKYGLPENLKENQELKVPIIIPILKTENGWKQISKQQIIEEKIIDEQLYFEMEEKALLLFQKGKTLLQKNKVILAEAKYHFGTDEAGNLMLVDQIHTPDSSRMWLATDLQKKAMQFPDRECVKPQEGYLSIKEPQEIQERLRDSYIQILKALTGQNFSPSSLPTKQRILTRLKNAKIIRGFFISILVSNEEESSHMKKITEIFDEKKIPYRISIIKNMNELESHMKTFNRSSEPVVYIMIEGKEFAFAKQGALKSAWPVICTALFEMDPVDSSLLHTEVPVLTVKDPVNVANSAIKFLQVSEL